MISKIIVYNTALEQVNTFTHLECKEEKNMN